MRRRSIIGVLVLALMALGLPASATIHETVAAACNGKGFLDPAPLTFSNFGFIGQSGKAAPADHPLFPTGTVARPVIANGVVDFDTLMTTDKKASKFPVGTDVTDPDLSVDDLDHRSSDNCFNLRP